MSTVYVQQNTLAPVATAATSTTQKVTVFKLTPEDKNTESGINQANDCEAVIGHNGLLAKC